MLSEMPSGNYELFNVVASLITLGICIVLSFLFGRFRRDVFLQKLQEVEYELFNYRCRNNIHSLEPGFGGLTLFVLQLRAHAADIGPMQVSIMQHMAHSKLERQHVARAIENIKNPEARLYCQSLYSHVMLLTQRYIFYQRVLGWVMLPFAPKNEALCTALMFTFETREKASAMLSEIQNTLDEIQS